MKTDTGGKNLADSSAPRHLPSLCFIVPTLRRPEFLRRCLGALMAQTVQPTRVLVGVRRDDLESLKVVMEFSQLLPVIGIEVAGVGVIGSMNSCLRDTVEEIVALVDDDAFPRPDWTERVLSAFATENHVVGVGGRDLQTNPDHCDSRTDLVVGRLTWYGRLLGNHHLGTGSVRTVQVLKGCNCAYRGAFLRTAGFDLYLRGQGAQVGWEISLGFDAMNSGGVLLYDPAIIVDHMIAPRLDTDTIHRGTYDREAAFDIAANFFSIVRRKAPQGICGRMLLWELMVGSVPVPGLLRIVDRRVGRFSERLRRIRTTLQAFLLSLDRASQGSVRRERLTVVPPAGSSL